MPKAKKTRKNQHPTDAGKRFLEAIEEKGYPTARDFYKDLGEKIGTKWETIETKFSGFINKNGAFPNNYMLQTERLLGVSIRFIVDNEGDNNKGPIGLYEVGSQGSYASFDYLLSTLVDSQSPLLSSDEFSKQIGNYVLEFDNIEGLRFLADHHYVNVKAPGLVTLPYFTRFNRESDLDISKMVLKTIAKRNGKLLFAKLLDNPESFVFGSEKTLLDDEESLKLVLRSESLLEAVMREPTEVTEERLNAAIRQLPKDQSPYQALVYSHWLTPLLNYAITHGEFKKQALKLIDFSKTAAKNTYRRIIDCQELLSSSGMPSITTRGGLVFLDHNYVIGVIGEPTVESSISDAKISRATDSLSAELAKIRALSLFPNEAINNGKIHVQRPEDNPVFKTFLHDSQGNPFLLQLSDDKGGDQHQNVFLLPKGKKLEKLPSTKTWESIGKGLSSIHSIETEKEGKVYCHGSFGRKQFWVNGDELSAITGYEKVYLGEPIEDLSDLVEFIFSFSSSMETRQDSVLALITGYGSLPGETVSEVASYFMGLSEKEKDDSKSRYYWNLAWEIKKARSYDHR